MSEAAEGFARDFVEALPEGMAREISSFNFQMGYAIGQALEKMPAPAERHVHYHVPNGAVLSAEGDVIQIKPWLPDDEATATNALPVRGGPLDGKTINVSTESGIANFLEPVIVEGYRKTRRWTYMRYCDADGLYWSPLKYEWVNPMEVTGEAAEIPQP